MPQHPDSSIRGGIEETTKSGARIKVVGVGGGGNNAVNRMIEAGLEGVEFISMNTDLQPLENSKAHIRLQLGARLTRGLGTGADPDLGRRAALEDSENIIEALEGADMVFVTTGLGGGTGTGAAPVIAALAGQMGALTVAIVTRPFGFEGKRRMKQAEYGVQELLDQVDTLIVIPNDKLLAVARDAGFFDSFRIADDVLRQAVQGITDIITMRGVINRDLADVRTTMAGMGHAVMGTATRSGPNRAVEAAVAAITSPLVEAGAIDGARGILINITGSSSLKLSEVSQASTIIQQAAHEDANIIFGAVLDERLKGDVKVTVIATGFREESRLRAELRLQALNDVQQPTMHYEDTPQRGAYAPIRPHVVVTAEPLFVEASIAEAEPILNTRGATSIASVEEDGSVDAETTPPTETSEQAFTDTPELYFTNEWFDDDLPANVDALDLRPDTAFEGTGSAAMEEPSAQPEIVRLRQAALAAYAASAITEQEEEEPLLSEEATFAEIMASRSRVLEPIASNDEVYDPPSAFEETELEAVDSADSGFFNTPVFRQSASPAPEREQASITSQPSTNIPSFTGSRNRDELSTEFDELDIPAFLRRNP